MYMHEGASEAFQVAKEFVTRYEPRDPMLKQLRNYEQELYAKCEKIKDQSDQIVCVSASEIQYVTRVLRYIETTGPQKLCQDNIKKEQCFNAVNKRKEKLKQYLAQLKNSHRVLLSYYQKQKRTRNESSMFTSEKYLEENIVRSGLKAAGLTAGALGASDLYARNQRNKARKLTQQASGTKDAKQKQQLLDRVAKHRKRQQLAKITMASGEE